jgi:hypothetical protein
MRYGHSWIQIINAITMDFCLKTIAVTEFLFRAAVGLGYLRASTLWRLPGTD